MCVFFLHSTVWLKKDPSLPSLSGSLVTWVSLVSHSNGLWSLEADFEVTGYADCTLMSSLLILSLLWQVLRIKHGHGSLQIAYTFCFLHHTPQHLTISCLEVGFRFLYHHRLSFFVQGCTVSERFVFQSLVWSWLRIAGVVEARWWVWLFGFRTGFVTSGVTNHVRSPVV